MNTDHPKRPETLMKNELQRRSPSQQNADARLSLLELPPVAYDLLYLPSGHIRVYPCASVVNNPVVNNPG